MARSSVKRANSSRVRRPPYSDEYKKLLAAYQRGYQRESTSRQCVRALAPFARWVLSVQVKEQRQLSLSKKIRKVAARDRKTAAWKAWENERRAILLARRRERMGDPSVWRRHRR